MSEAGRAYTDMVQALNQFLDPEPDFEHMPVEQIDAELRRADIDPNPLIRRVQLMVGKYLSVPKLAKARALRKRLSEFLTTRSSSSATQQKQYVVPHDGKWAVCDENNRSASSVYDTRTQAIVAAKQMILKRIQATYVALGMLAPAMNFRKLEEVTESDLLSVLDDLSTLKQLESTDAGNRT